MVSCNTFREPFFIADAGTCEMKMNELIHYLKTGSWDNKSKSNLVNTLYTF